jgi:hypothetical protein
MYARIEILSHTRGGGGIIKTSIPTVFRNNYSTGYIFRTYTRITNDDYFDVIILYSTHCKPTQRNCRIIGNQRKRIFSFFPYSVGLVWDQLFLLIELIAIMIVVRFMVFIDVTLYAGAHPCRAGRTNTYNRTFIIISHFYPDKIVVVTIYIIFYYIWPCMHVPVKWLVCMCTRGVQ